MLALLGGYGVEAGVSLFQLLALAIFVCAAAYLVWHVGPAYAICGAVLLSPFAGNWNEFGIPGYFAPDRILLLVGIAAVLLGATGGRERLTVRLSWAHLLLFLAAAYVVVSAAFAGTLTQQGPFFKLLEPYGLAPFALFVVAPLIFRSAHERDLLLKTFVILGAYLSLTTLFDALHLDALVWPKYILDPAVGTHAGRGRGPFVEAVTNGFALYVCAVACAIAWWRWYGRANAQRVAAAVALLCLAGAFMSLERSVWLGAVVGTALGVLTVSQARRYLPAVVAVMAVAVVGSLLLIPGFAQQVSNRADNQQTIWDRKNQSRAALNMLEARPLLGFGWNTFRRHNRDYFQQAREYPLGREADLNLHSTMLTYAVELGLIGFLLWIGALVTGVGGGLATRGPPDLRGWRSGLLAVAAAYVVVTNFVPPSAFPNLALWLWAGVCWAGRYAGAGESGDAPGATARATG